MKIKTSELTGAALDWAVAKAEGWQEWDAEDSWELAGFFAKDGDFSSVLFLHTYSPSTSWAQGGPIIEREQIYWIDNGRTDRAGKPFKWMATRNFSDPLNNFYGPTHLIAAMRCYVASSLGDEIEIPDSLGE